MDVFHLNLLMTATQRLYVELDKLAERHPGFRLGDALSVQLRQTFDEVQTYAGGSAAHGTTTRSLSLDADDARQLLHDVLIGLRQIAADRCAGQALDHDLHHDIERWLATSARNRVAETDEGAQT